MKRVRKCIITRYLKDSNEIEAEYEFQRVRVRYPPAGYGTFDRAHALAVKALCEKLGWGKRRPAAAWCSITKGFIFVVSVPADVGVLL